MTADWPALIASHFVTARRQCCGRSVLKASFHHASAATHAAPDLVVSMSSDGEVDHEVDHNDSFCAVCADGGELDVCTGQCHRTFHRKCLQSREKQRLRKAKTPFRCNRCVDRIQACYICGELGDEVAKFSWGARGQEGGNTGVLKCPRACCGKFFHPRCLDEWTGAQWQSRWDPVPPVPAAEDVTHDVTTQDQEFAAGARARLEAAGANRVDERRPALDILLNGLGKQIGATVERAKEAFEGPRHAGKEHAGKEQDVVTPSPVSGLELSAAEAQEEMTGAGMASGDGRAGAMAAEKAEENAGASMDGDRSGASTPESSEERVTEFQMQSSEQRFVHAIRMATSEGQSEVVEGRRAGPASRLKEKIKQMEEMKVQGRQGGFLTRAARHEPGRIPSGSRAAVPAQSGRGASRTSPEESPTGAVRGVVQAVVAQVAEQQDTRPGANAHAQVKMVASLPEGAMVDEPVPSGENVDGRSAGTVSAQQEATRAHTPESSEERAIAPTESSAQRAGAPADVDVLGADWIKELWPALLQHGWMQIRGKRHCDKLFLPPGLNRHKLSEYVFRVEYFDSKLAVRRFLTNGPPGPNGSRAKAKHAAGAGRARVAAVAAAAATESEQQAPAEPGSEPQRRTRRTTVAESSRAANAEPVRAGQRKRAELLAPDLDELDGCPYHFCAVRENAPQCPSRGFGRCWHRLRSGLTGAAWGRLAGLWAGWKRCAVLALSESIPPHLLPKGHGLLRRGEEARTPPNSLCATILFIIHESALEVKGGLRLQDARVMCLCAAHPERRKQLEFDGLLPASAQQLPVLFALEDFKMPVHVSETRRCDRSEWWWCTRPACRPKATAARWPYPSER